MRLIVLLALLSILLLPIVSPTVLAATCGDGVAEGGEECDGADLRGYDCTTKCHLNRENPRDYNENSDVWRGQAYYECKTYGTLACDNNCELKTNQCFFHVCGNGDMKWNEECDDGAQNSDADPDACRTDCQLPRCGDGTVDSGEQCDDGSQNDDEMPDACRSDCTLPSCGDGIIDVAEGEECDEEWSGTCHKCRRCVEPRDNLVIDRDTTLCSGTYQLNDEGREGVIIVEGQGILVDCDNVFIYNIPMQVAQLDEQNLNPNIQNLQLEQESPTSASAPVQANGGFFANIGNFFASIFGGEEAHVPESSPIEAPAVFDGMGLSERRVGTGFYVLGSENTLIDCEVHGYKTGIKVEGERNAIITNRACQNDRDIYVDVQSNNVGVGNTCRSGTWSDAGYETCTYDCDGSMNPEVAGASCPECPLCENEATSVEAESSSESTRPESSESESSESESSESESSESESSEPEVELHVECWDGSYAATEEACPEEEACPGQLECANGFCVDELWECDPHVCCDGSVVASESECAPPCDEDEFVCDDCHCVDEAWMCRPYVCEDGTWAPSKNECPDEGCSLEKPRLCADEYTCVADMKNCPDADACSGVTCPDGTCVDSIAQCPQEDLCPGEVECGDGTCAKSEEMCTVCCKTTGGLAAPLTYYNEMTQKECVDARGAVVENKFC
jgi:hypothetical protein